MSENFKEASVVMAKCKMSHKPYGIRIERRTDNVWYCTWAFKLTEKAASNEGYGNTMMSGKVKLDPEYPGCPHCGSSSWIQCGSCGKLTCADGREKHFTCTWCKFSGEVHTKENFDLSGGEF